MNEDRSPFEWSAEQVAQAWRQCGEMYVGWWQELASMAPAGRTLSPSEGRREVQTLGDDSQEFATVLQEALARLKGDAQVVGHPAYLAYVAGAANPVAPMAQALAMMMNPYTGTYATAPAAVALEDEALGWIKELVNWPQDAFAWMTSGSSLAILSAVIAARESRKFPAGRRRIYASDQAHHCLGKACFAAGFSEAELCLIPSRGGRLDEEALAQQIAKDRREAWEPLMVFATAGTTNAGCVDSLASLASLCEREQLWYHIDGAYGGFFAVLPEIEVLQGLERADSLSLDPHKALSMPYGTGILLCKKAHAHALSWPRGLNATYMPELSPEQLRFEYSDISPELSRDFRGLRLWMSLKTFGKQAFRDHLREKHQLAHELASLLARDERLELLSKPELSLFAFAVRNDEGGDKTRSLHAEILKAGRFYLTTARFQERLAIRVCLLGFRFHRQHLQELKKEIDQALGRISV